MQTTSPRHWLLLAFLIFSWGSAIILTRVAVADIPPLWVTAGRLVSGAFLLAAYRLFFVRKTWTLTWGHAPWILVLAILTSAAPFLLIAWGTQYTSSAIAGILMGSIPLIVLGLAHIFLPDEKLTKEKAFGFSIGFLGVILVISPWTHAPEAQHASDGFAMEFIAQIAIFIAATCYASSSIATRRMPKADNLDKATMVVITAAILLLVACSLMEPFPQLQSDHLDSWLILLYLGIVPTSLASIVLFVLLSETSAGFVSMSNYMIPVVTALGGIAFLGEQLQTTAWIGFATILAGLVISNKKRRLPS